MQLFAEKYQCCGCTACKHICPVKAITMVSDEEGFSYPLIDRDICIGCGNCLKVCCLKNLNRFSSETESVIGYKAKDLSIRMESSSGGAFSMLCTYVISRGGVVAGACFDDSFRVVHRIADNLEDCAKFRGSKYVQSDLGDVYPEIGAFLRDSICVLFTGTPCQCDGLKNYLSQKKIPQDHLIVCDMVCHGVPSPMIWGEYLDFTGAAEGLTDYRFRDKRFGWHGDNITAIYADGKERSNTPKLKIYPTLYFRNYITRPSCGHCIYTNYQRCSDMTIADFWGIEKASPEFDDNKGVSMILVNTPKGREIIDAVADAGEVWESSFEAVAQEQLERPVHFAEDRERFWSDYRAKGFGYIAEKYGHYDLYHRIRRRIVNLIKKYR